MNQCPEFMQRPANRIDYDEYMVVVQGCYTLIINGQRFPLNSGDEHFIRRGTAHSGEVATGPDHPLLWRPSRRLRGAAFGLRQASA